MDQQTVQALLDEVLRQLWLSPDQVARDPIRVWPMSGVERLTCHEGEGETLVLKYARGPFAGEPRVLRHAARHRLPVPRVFADAAMHESDGTCGCMVMVMEDLGRPLHEVGLADAAAAAVEVHGVPPLGERPVLTSRALAELPALALRRLGNLQDEGRWLGGRIPALLKRLAVVAPSRARDAECPPYGLVHGEFHPSSLMVDRHGQRRVLDMARACTGPGLFDLVSWQGTTSAPDRNALRDLLAAYVAHGGIDEAFAERAGLPAVEWAIGWHRVWICQWYIEQALRWIPDRAQDTVAVAVVIQHLNEAITALRA